jgi:3-oxoacyl-[acyl-carrier protein] reductase
MSDFLLEKGNKGIWKKIFKTIGVPVPTKLIRVKESWKKNILQHKNIITGSAKGGIDHTVINAVYSELGGLPIITTLAPGQKANALVYDGTGIQTVEDLKNMYEFFKNNVRKLGSCSRVVIICNSVPKSIEKSEINSPEAYVEFCAVQQGIEGFSRSVAKEIGAKGATINLVRLLASKGATSQALLPYLHFLLSDAGAFVTGQVLEVDMETSTKQAVPVEQSLAGKTAIVTGSARGIGEGTARRLALEGATVVILDRPADAEAGKAVAASINGKFLGVDMSAEDAPATIRDFIKNELGGGVDIVVHNAGITRDKTIGNMDAAAWDMVISVNLNAIIRTNKELLKSGVIKENGRIISLSSTSGIAGNFGQTNYATTKAGVIGYVKSLSQITKDKKITVNAIAPGFIETAMTAKIPGMTKFFGRRLSALSQGGLPSDIANMIAFLSTPGASGISGQTIRVCGGNFLGA